MTPASQQDECRQLVSDLSVSVTAWRHRWPLLGDRLDHVQVFFARLKEQSPDYLLAHEAVNALSSYYSRFISDQLMLNDLHPLLEKCNELEARARQQSDWDQPGKLYGSLHAIKNIVSNLQVTAANIKTDIERVLKPLLLLEPEDEIIPIRRDLESVAEELSAGARPDIERLTSLCLALQVRFPPRTMESYTAIPSSSHLGEKIFMLAVEDDESWLPDIVRVIESVAATYRLQGREIIVHSARTYKDAEEKLKEVSGSSGDWSINLVLDLGIPQDAAELARIETKKSTVGRIWGRKLLQIARSYKRRYNVIVLTTQTDYPTEHQMALESGVAPQDYILKDIEALTDLGESLHRMLAPQKAPRLEILLDTQRRVRLNSVEIDLDPTPFSILCVLGENRRRALGVKDIADILEQQHLDKYNQRSEQGAAWEQAKQEAIIRGFIPDTPEFQKIANEILHESYAPSNALESWQQALRSQGENAESRICNRRLLTAFYEYCSGYENALPWRWFANQAGLPATSPKAWGEALIAKACRTANQEFSARRLRSKNFDPDTIYDHIYHIRNKVFEYANIDPERYFLRTEDESDTHRYRLLAETFFLSSESVLPEKSSLDEDEKCRILVVENDDAWLEDIKNILSKGGYIVGFSKTVAQAIKLAADFQPHILCLDLHLPFDDRELELWLQDNSFGSRTGGIEVLRQTQSQNPFVKVLILSELTREVDIRIQATRAGVSIQAIIPKEQPAEGIWQSKLLRAVWQTEQELRRGVLLPKSATNLPFIAIDLEETGSRSRSAVISTAVGKKSVPLGAKEFQLLKIFRQVGNRPISRDSLLERIYGDDWSDKEMAFDNVLKRLRQALVQNGLGLTGEEARRAGSAIISQAGGTYLVTCKLS